MAGGYAWSRRVGARVRSLRGLVLDTQRALQDVRDILPPDEAVPAAVRTVGARALARAALVVLGEPGARARLLHALLGRRLLPERVPRPARWVRVQFGGGAAPAVRLALASSEFELVEPLASHAGGWDELPEEDLMQQGEGDLSTVLEVELNNQFLRDGLIILIPPDLPADPGTYNLTQLKNIHSEFYQKRASILKNFNCIFLYAIDSMGKNIFSDNICGNSNLLRSDEDFWDTFNLYTGVKSESDKERSDSYSDNVGEEGGGWAGWELDEPAVFSPERCLELQQMRELSAHAQPLLVLLRGARAPGGGRMSSESPEPHESERDRQTRESERDRLTSEQTAFMNELVEQWELMTGPPQKHYIKSKWLILDDAELMSTVDLKHAPAYTAGAYGAGETCGKGRKDEKLVWNRSVLLGTVAKFATEAMHSYLLEYCTRLSEVHIRLVQRFILTSFEMARELQVVPKKIQYVAVHEQHLFETIYEKFSSGEKRQELVQLMEEVLQEMEAEVTAMDWCVDDLPCHRERNLVSSAPLPAAPRPPSPAPAPSDGEEALASSSLDLDEYDIIDDSYSDCYNSRAEDDSPLSPARDIPVENESEMFSLSSSGVGGWGGGGGTWSTRSDACCGRTVSVKHATLDVQQTVLARLSRKISLKLVNFFDCLKESYFGTLQRCLESLERSCRAELGGAPASEAMRQLLSVGRRVTLQPQLAFSLLRTLVDSLRRILAKLRLSGAPAQEACCALSPAWRRRVAAAAVRALCPHRLVSLISTQIIDRLSAAHERYQAALGALQAALTDRLHHTEDAKLAIRKKYAPLFARLCLESTSMCDLLVHGAPDLGREIGRGQYGVVYAARGGWGGRSPAAVKSVLPADERHYRDLAMEFFYTRTIPAHPRVVPLYGSVVQRAGGGARAVLLVTERRARDLHAAVRAGLSAAMAMQIALDIVEGIRYLHSLGLIHRDIKLKNVLLDANNRAALSDLGFCAAGALMSGSVVGTPVHMAPELLAGEYCAAVDVYAFGVLFWYLCAGDVKLPAAFETFNNKEQLWTKVKKGLRPERLPQFSDECWSLMSACWRADADRRPLLGDIHQRLTAIHAGAAAGETAPAPAPRPDHDDSLDMTFPAYNNFDM